MGGKDNMIIPKQGASLDVEPLGSLQGVKFDDVYEIGRELNSGAFGVVYEGYHVLNPNDSMAIKVKERYAGDETEEETLHEVSILKHLSNIQGVIPLIDFYMDDSLMYIIQVMAEGGDVLDRLMDREIYTEKDARELARNLLSTIDNLHMKKVVHRDIKAENLLLKEVNNHCEIWICDFGDAKIVHPENGELLKTFCGTPGYTAPELLDDQGYSFEVDMWSAGVTIFLLLGGYLPFGMADEDVFQEEIFTRTLDCDYDFNDDAWDVVSTDAKDLIRKLLVLDPKNRLTSKQALQCDWFTSVEESILEKSNLQKSLAGMKKFCSVRYSLRYSTGTYKLNPSTLRALDNLDEDGEIPTSSYSQKPGIVVRKRKILNQPQAKDEEFKTNANDNNNDNIAAIEPPKLEVTQTAFW